MTSAEFAAINQRRLARGQNPLTFTESPGRKRIETVNSTLCDHTERGFPRIATAASMLADKRERETAKKATQLITANGFALAPSKDEAKLNRTERAYLAVLRSHPAVTWIGIQSFTLKLADDCRLTPDFSTLDRGGKLTLIDVKGFQREDALIKMKVAARMFPMFTFVIAKRDGGDWKTQIVSP